MDWKERILWRWIYKIRRHPNVMICFSDNFRSILSIPPLNYTISFYITHIECNSLESFSESLKTFELFSDLNIKLIANFSRSFKTLFSSDWFSSFYSSSKSIDPYFSFNSPTFNPFRLFYVMNLCQNYFTSKVE